MYNRRTDFSLGELLSGIQYAPTCLIANEIGIILMTTERDVERAMAENKLVELLNHNLEDTRFPAYGYLSEYIATGNKLFDISLKALKFFKMRRENIKLIKCTETTTESA